MARKELPEISAGSMADIAFLLLIFFLVTTSMDNEKVIKRTLPQITNESDAKKVEDNNVIEILLNNQNKVLFEGSLIEIEEVSDKVYAMILNKKGNPEWPETKPYSAEGVTGQLERAKRAYEEAEEIDKKTKLKLLNKAKLRAEAFELFGNDYQNSSHVVSIQATKGSDYGAYIQLSDQILAAYKRMMMDQAKKKGWGKKWSDLDGHQKNLLKIVYKQNISEASTVEGG